METLTCSHGSCLYVLDLLQSKFQSSSSSSSSSSVSSDSVRRSWIRLDLGDLGGGLELRLVDREGVIVAAERGKTTRCYYLPFVKTRGGGGGGGGGRQNKQQQQQNGREKSEKDSSSRTCCLV